MSVSPVFEINCLVRCRSGRLLRTQDKTQFFFDEQGNVQAATSCCGVRWIQAVVEVVVLRCVSVVVH
jgi:hypothetical protein